MADVKWIKITTDIFDDEKVLLIESLPDADAIIVIWFKLLCLAGKMNNSGVFLLNNSIPYTDQMLSIIFRRKETTVKLALQTFEQFGMVEIVDGVITIPNWGKHQNIDQLQAKKEYMQKYMQQYRVKQKALTSSESSCKTNGKTNSKANVSSIDKDKEIDKENILYFCPSSCVDVRHTDEKTDHFDLDRCWREYPNKKGKNKITKKALAELDKLGTEKMLLAIGRYKAEIERNKTDMQYIQHGSTFFNGGYADYIAEDWKLPERKNGDGLPVYDDFEIPF